VRKILIFLLLIILGAIFLFWLVTWVQDWGANSLSAVRSQTPIDILSREELADLEIDSGQIKDPLKRAYSILAWQEEHIFYCSKPEAERAFPDIFIKGYQDCDEDALMNEMVLGSFPTSRVLKKKVKNGKIYGQSYTFATTYCAIARSLDLRCRVMATKSCSTDRTLHGWIWHGPGYCGLVERKFVRANNLKCLEWFKQDYRTGPKHYWAEVMIGNQIYQMTRNGWRYGQDGEEELINEGDFQNTGW